MAFLVKRGRTDGKGHIGLFDRKISGYLILLTAIFIVVIVCMCVRAYASYYYHYMYEIKMKYTKQKVTLNFVMEDLEGTCIGHDYAGASVYAFDTYLRDDRLAEGQWQLNMDIRKSGLVKVTETDFSNSDKPAAEADITKLYNDTAAFKKKDSESVECNKEVTRSSVTFSGNVYYNYVVLAVIPKGNPTDTESLYKYLEQVTYDKAGRKARYTFFDYTIIMRCTSGQYKINNDEWTDCEKSKTFNFEDYKDGDVLTFRTVYEDGSYSAPISHVIAKLNVLVDPNGGTVNGHNEMFRCVSAGDYADNVYIAQNDQVLPEFDANVCEREGYEFDGFEFEKGCGDILEVESYAYRTYIRITNIRTGKTAVIEQDVSENIIDKCGNEKEAVRQYYVEYYKNMYGNSAVFKFTDNDIWVTGQKKIKYYVNSELLEVTVRARWKPLNGEVEKEPAARNYICIKKAALMYNASMMKRTEGDDEWYFKSSRLRLRENMDSYSDIIGRHYKIMPTGEIKYIDLHEDNISRYIKFM